MKKLIILLSLLSLSTKTNKEYCDIKGNIKKPGIYEIKENYTIQDIINEAGGLKKNSYTNNINLSKKVTDEMVIYIFTENEIKNLQKEKVCKCEPIYKYIECEEEKTTLPIITKPITTTKITTTKAFTIQETTTQSITQEIHNKKININTATLEELITLNGLGESKAKNIIEYRNTNGYFNKIEELLNVKGIGQKIFDGIKELIEI